MMKTDSIFNSAERVWRGVENFFQSSVASLCSLETVDGETTLVAGDGSMATVFHLEGAYKVFGDEEFAWSVSNLKSSLGSLFESPGHIIQVVVERDPASVQGEIEKRIRPMRNTASNLGVRIDQILDDKVKSLSKYTASEKIMLVCWTLPTSLPPSSRKEARVDMQKGGAELPSGDGLMRPNRVMKALRHNHSAFVKTLQASLEGAGLLSRILEVHEALHHVAKSVDAHSVGEKWRPRLPGDPFPLRQPDAGVSNEAAAAVMYPSLDWQLCPREAKTTNDFLVIGERVHCPFVLELAPSQPKPFNVLWRELVKYPFPWRLTMRIGGEGFKIMGLAQLILSVFGWSSSKNKPISSALKDLRKAVDEGDEQDVDFSMCFDTWVDGESDEHIKALHSQVSQMKGAVQAWGTCEVRHVTGDPLLPFSATIPAFNPGTPATKAVAPLSEIIELLPFTRPASAWNNGNVLFRTPDGKLFPFDHFSSQQTSWIELGAAPMGGGKSILLNSLNFDFIFKPGLVELPYLGIIDIGFSSNGLITLLKTILPEELKHMVVSEKLRNKLEYAVNPFDTPLGCRQPLEHHMAFLINLLCTFCAPLENDADVPDVVALVRHAIEEAYKDMSKTGAKVYDEHVDSDVDKAIEHYNLDIDENTTWWEIVDKLFDRGNYHAAMLAQRYAVPQLPEMPTYLSDSRISSQSAYDYTETTTGQHITQFASRKISEAVKDYPIFGGPTKFDLGAARIVSLDLNDVALKGGAVQNRQTGIMYLLAMHVVAGKFSLQPEEVKYIPEKYRAYHAKEIKFIRETPKRLCMDEYHRAMHTQGVNNHLSTLVRESRKWRLGIALYSQEIFDFPEDIINFATSIYLLGTGTSQDYLNRLAKLYGLNDTARTNLRSIGKPDERGALFFVIYATAKQQILQQLMLTLGPVALWAFTSTPDDVAVRNELMERLGSEAALPLLAAVYPKGVQTIVEHRSQKYADLGKKRDVLEDLVTELVELYGQQRIEKMRKDIM